MKVLSGKSTTWYDIQPPTQRDIAMLKEELNIHSLVLEELLPAIHYPKLDLYSDHFFLVLQAPILDTKTGEVEIEEIDFIVGKSWLVTSHYKPLEVVDQLFDRLTQSEKSERIFLGDPVEVLIYNILSTFLQSSLQSLNRLEEQIETMENAVVSGQERKMVIAISQLRRDIIDFRRSISPARPVFRALDDIGPALLGAQSLPYFRNLTGRIEQISTLLKSQKEAIEALEETNQALLTTRTNDIVRTLTVFAAMALPLTLVSSIFGMNVGLPAWFNFKTILLIMVGFGIALFTFFRSKRWL